MREVLRRYQDATASVIARHDGHVAQYLGDGVLAYFGWPRAREDQAVQAVRAGLAVMDAMTALHAPDGKALRARIGIASGQVVVGELAGLPGRIRTITKHPMLVATKIWALAHLLANGSLADVILFGSFLVWAVADRISLKRRSPLSVPSLPSSRVNDAIAVVLGLALYLAFIFGVHAWLFGVSPI